MRSRLLALVMSAGVVAGVAAVPAGAVNVPLDRVVSANPADWVPWATNGRVYALVPIGTTMYVGGTFTQTQEPTASTFARPYLFAFDMTTGAISKTFKPSLDGPVNALATDGTSLFVGGDFTTVNGASHHRIVALDAAGAIVGGFAADVTTGSTVDDLVVANGLLFVAGAFTQVNATARSGLAAVDPVSGTLAPGVNLAFTGLHNNGVSHVAKIDVSPNSATLVAVGNFTAVAGQAREQMAMLDLAGQTATLSSWSTQRFVMQCASKFDTYTRDVDIDPTGTYVVVGTTGAFFGGVGSNTLCDSVSRWELGRTGASQQPTWVDYEGGDTNWSVTATGTAIYTGGHYRWVNNPYAGDTVGPGTIKRRAIAALDPVNGMPLSWNPGRSPGEGVFIMISTPEGLWVGHDTNTIGHEYHPRLAFFPIAEGTTIPAPTVATLPGELYSLPSGISGAQLWIAHRSFNGSTPGARIQQSSSIDWSRARGAFYANGKIYYGWDDGKFYRRTFTGGSFGAAKVVATNGLVPGYFPIPSVTGMFLQDGRLYYTVSGDDRLYYRYFTVESNAVGAVTFVASAPGSGFDWGSVRGLTLAGTTLYLARADGTLWSAGWTRDWSTDRPSAARSHRSAPIRRSNGPRAACSCGTPS